MVKNPTAFSKTLRRLMEAHLVHGKPISANELGKRIGVPQSSITRALSGTEPRGKNAQKMAAYFKVSVAELRGEAVENGTIPVKRKDDDTSYLIYVHPSEAELVTAYRESSPAMQQTIAATVKTLAAQSPRPMADVVKFGKK